MDCIAHDGGAGFRRTARRWPMPRQADSRPTESSAASSATTRPRSNTSARWQTLATSSKSVETMRWRRRAAARRRRAGRSPPWRRRRRRRSDPRRRRSCPRDAASGRRRPSAGCRRTGARSAALGSFGFRPMRSTELHCGVCLCTRREIRDEIAAGGERIEEQVLADDRFGTTDSVIRSAQTRLMPAPSPRAERTRRSLHHRARRVRR